MFSVISNIYNKKIKEPTLMELFTARGKVKNFFLTTIDVRCVHHGDTSHIDTIFMFLLHTHVNMGASIFFNAAMICAFRSVRSHGNGGTNTFAYETHIAQ